MNLTKNKLNGLKQISNDNNIIFATAMDQRGSLGKMISSFNEDITYQDGLVTFKEGISKILGNNSSSLLLDPEYGWPATKKLNDDIGLIMAYEKTGYDATEKGRLPNLVDNWSVQDLKKNGVHALKFLVYYDINEMEKFNKIKQTMIKRVGDECKYNDILFILEPVAYDAKEGNKEEYLKRKPQIVEFFMQEFSKSEYGVDLLKVEVPVSIFNIEGYDKYSNYNPIFTKNEAAKYYENCSNLSKVPFIYLSGGVTNEQFIDTLYFAKESEAKFNGILCGRATWKEGIQTFAEKGEDEFSKWLSEQGLENLKKVENTLLETATPLKF